MKKLFPLLTLSSLLMTACHGSTPVWDQFVQAQKSGEETILPDFSYAGYKNGEVPIPDVQGPVFSVTSFGAVPNDNVSDEPALRQALKAAEAAGGGVVQFPAGEFLFNTDTDIYEPIEINSGNIVLRGAGFSKDGTIFRVVRHFEPEDPTKMYSTPFYLLFKTKGQMGTGKEITQVTAPAKDHGFQLSVADASNLKAGQRVTLHMQSTEAVGEFLAPKTADPEWKRLFETGVLVTERHIIKSVDGNVITLAEPLRVNVNPDFGWTVRTYEPIENVGVEDICFMGGFEQDFVHHRSAYDDGAWSMLRMEGLANSWIRRCAFINTNHAIEIRSSAQLSVLGVIIEGNPSHFGMHARAGYGVFGGLIENRGWSWHGPSVGYQGVGTVYWRCTMRPEQRVDSHSGQPYATLHDNTKGGILYGSGGPTVGLPHHLHDWVLWNFEYQGDVDYTYDLWDPKRKDKFLMPIIVGFHGHPVTFNEENLELLESYGTPVQPESLWEAQMANRLGAVPSWVSEFRTEWETLSRQELPYWKDIGQATPGTANDDDTAAQP